MCILQHLLHRMKNMQNNRCADTPVVALTANAITGAKEMYLAEGFDAFLPKPINPEKLEQMILKLLPRELLRFDLENEEDTASVEVVGSRIESRMERELPVVDGIDWSYGRLHLPDDEMLMGTVCDFYKTLAYEAETLDGFYRQFNTNQDMVAQYRIKVHSMKSSANLIGAIVLGGMARVLESAAAKSDIAVIDSMHDIFIREWLSYKEKLAECVADFSDDDINDLPKEEVRDYTVIKTYLEELKAAAAEFDIDAMDEVMKRLESFTYPENIAVNMEKLGVFVTNMDCDGASDMIEAIISEIE